VSEVVGPSGSLLHGSGVGILISEFFAPFEVDSFEVFSVYLLAKERESTSVDNVELPANPLSESFD